MRARLLITYSMGHIPDGTAVPFAPPLLVEDGGVGMFTSDWVKRFDNTTLDMLTEREVRDRLCLDSSVAVFLSPVRQVPDLDLYSETVSDWRQQWWLEVVAALQPQLALACAS